MKIICRAITTLLLCLTSGMAAHADGDFREPVILSIPGKNYALGKHEVTQAEWEAVMGSNPSKLKAANLPVERVSWNDVQDYLKRLNQKTGKRFRLPTEAEWEYACYGGRQTKYCGGDDADAVAWHNGNSGGKPHPVGEKQANGYGLYDMSGNVWEWTADCWEGDCTKHALRGGGWYSVPQEVQSSIRDWEAASKGSFLIGFRLARTLP